MNHEVQAIKAERRRQDMRRRVYHELDNTYYSVGPGSFIDDLYKTLGATNIAESTGEAYPQLSAEAIIAANPDVIILADEGAGESADTVAARPGWTAIAAVKNDRVYADRPGHRQPRRARASSTRCAQLEADLYPERRIERTPPRRAASTLSSASAG